MDKAKTVDSRAEQRVVLPEGFIRDISMAIDPKFMS